MDREGHLGGRTLALVIVLAVLGGVGALAAERVIVRRTADCTLSTGAQSDLQSAAVAISDRLQDGILAGPQSVASANGKVGLSYTRACAIARGTVDHQRAAVRSQVVIFSSWGRFEYYLQEASYVSDRVANQIDFTPDHVGPFVAIEGLGDLARSDLYCTKGSALECTEWTLIRRSAGCHVYAIDLAYDVSPDFLDRQEAEDQLLGIADQVESVVVNELADLDCSTHSGPTDERWTPPTESAI